MQVKTTEWFTCMGRSCSLFDEWCVLVWCAVSTVVLVRPAGQETRGTFLFDSCVGVRGIALSGDCVSLACSCVCCLALGWQVSL